MTLAARVARLVLARRRPAAPAAADLLAPRGAGDGAPRRPAAAPGAGPARHAAAPALPWCRHLPRRRRAAAARACAGASAWPPHFTIHDRGDAEDLMGLVRQELGLAATTKRFPLKGTCLAIYSRVRQQPAAAGRRCCDSAYPWCAGWEAELKRLFGAYVPKPSSSSTCSTTTTCCCTGGQMMAEPALAARDRRALRPRAGRRVPGHQPAAGRDPARAQARRPRPHGGRRRRAVDLRLPRAPRCATSSTSRQQFEPPARGAHAGAQLPLDAADPGRLERRHRAGRRALREEAVERPRRRPAAAAGDGGRRGGAGALGGRRRCWRSAKAA